MYLKINGSDEIYEPKLVQFVTQHGNEAVRVMNGMPQTNQGFKVYNDDDTVYSDFSEYVYTYREDEYTKVEEEIEYARATFEPLKPTALDVLNNKVNTLNTQVQEITPYTETKNVYIGDTECVFNTNKQGNISIFITNKDGNSIPNTFVREQDKIIVSFDELEEVATVTMNIL